MEKAVEAAQDFANLLQQPLTAMRLMVEGLRRGIITNSPEIQDNLLDCLDELQDYIDELNNVRGLPAD